MTVDTRWQDLKPQPQSRKELHERVVQDVAQARFEFPTPELPSYRTHVNVPEVTLPVAHPDGEELVPDIVVVDTPGNILKIVALVELGEDINEQRAREVWSRYAALKDVALYLYVPVGYGGATKELCKRLRLQVYGFRTWRYTPQGLEVNDISEPPDIMTALMPPIVRRILRGV